MCHTLIEKLASISSNGIAPKLNSDILAATARIMPRFDDLLRAIAADQVSFVDSNVRFSENLCCTDGNILILCEGVWGFE